MGDQHLHHYVDGICTGPAARPESCGAEQRYRPPQSHRSVAPPTSSAVLAEALQDAWNEFCSDTGCVPDAFTIRGPHRTTSVEADFSRGNFAEMVLDRIHAAEFALIDLRDEEPG